MLARKLIGYINFGRQCIRLLADQKLLVGTFLVLSVFGALTEGFTISLLVPLLDVQSGQKGFSQVPIIAHASDLFGQLSPGARIQAVVAVMAAAILLRNLLQYVVDVLGTLMPLRLERTLNLRAYKALMTVEFAYIQSTDYGHLLNVLTSTTQRVSRILSNATTLVWNIFIILIYMSMMLLVSWSLTVLAALFLLAVSLGLRWLSAGPLHRIGELWSAAAGRIQQIVMESIAGMKTIRLARAELAMTHSYAQAINEANASERRSATIVSLNGPVLSTCAGLFICALLFANVALREEPPVVWMSSIILFLFLLMRLMGPVNNINVARSRIAYCLDALGLLNKFFQETDRNLQPNGSRAAKPLSRSLVFDNVSFSYGPGREPVIDDVSTTIECGKMIAIVGPSGAGKSTLMTLVARLYDPQQGRILVDGIDLRELDVHSWRKRLAVITQDNFIFNDSAYNNIGFGRSDLSLQQVRAAAEMAAAAEFIENLPQGYETQLGDRGVRLSAGQQQRIAIARAMLADPDLVIFDEATSNLDTFTERAIQEAMERFSKNRTVLVIAHRLSTIRRAEKVLVMDNGRVIEEGSHRALLARRGVYWEMVEHQRLGLVKDEALDAELEASS